jgi:hypothetical protein
VMWQVVLERRSLLSPEGVFASELFALRDQWA